MLIGAGAEPLGAVAGAGAGAGASPKGALNKNSATAVPMQKTNATTPSGAWGPTFVPVKSLRATPQSFASKMANPKAKPPRASTADMMAVTTIVLPAQLPGAWHDVAQRRTSEHISAMKRTTTAMTSSAKSARRNLARSLQVSLHEPQLPPLHSKSRVKDVPPDVVKTLVASDAITRPMLMAKRSDESKSVRIPIFGTEGVT